MPFRGKGGVSGGGSSLIIDGNHFFADATARDSYFTAHPAEKTVGTFISVGSGYQQWDGSVWADKTAVVSGADGADGTDAPALKIQYSADDASYHATFVTGDRYQRVSVDDGVTWGSGMKFVGEDGTGGGADEATINSLIFAMR